MKKVTFIESCLTTIVVLALFGALLLGHIESRRLNEKLKAEKARTADLLERVQQWQMVAELTNLTVKPYITYGVATPHPPTIQWVGHPMVSDGDRWIASQGWLAEVQIGLRSDGVVVWTNVAALEKEGK